MIFLVLGITELCGEGAHVLLGGAEVRDALHVEEGLAVHVLDLLEEVHLLLHSGALAAHKAHDPRGLRVQEQDLHPAHLGRRQHPHHVLLLGSDDIGCHSYFFVIVSTCYSFISMSVFCVCVCNSFFLYVAFYLKLLFFIYSSLFFLT